MADQTIVQGVTITLPVDDARPQIRCACCQEYLGSIVEVRGQFFAVYGKRHDYALHGICPTCKTPYHWTNNDERLHRLMKRIA